MQQEKPSLLETLNQLKGIVPLHKERLYFVCNAYLAACQNGHLAFNPAKELLEFCNETNSYLTKTDVNLIKQMFESFSKDDLRHVVLLSLSNDLPSYKDSNEPTPNSIIEIAKCLLNIDGAGHVVVDIGSGCGGVLANILIDSQRHGFVLKELAGYEINREQAMISQMALDILSDGWQRPIIRTGNVLDCENFVCTRGYCFPPFGMRQLIWEKTKQSRVFRGIEFSSRNTSEWLFIDALLSGLHGVGRAVAIVSGRALFNYADEEYRRALIKSGLLEGIIELPSGSLNFTGIKPYMLVFSQENKVVKMIDASDATDVKTKRFNKVEVAVNKVLDLYNSPDAPVKDVRVLKDINNWIPSNVLLDVKKPKNGMPLGELAEVFTGNQYTLGVFEKNGMLSTEQTGYRILTSSDIENGLVDWKALHSIKYKDDKFDKYAVKKNDLVVTSKSSKVKTVVVDIEPKEKILVTGGMIVVRPNNKLLDPTYLKIFLDSEQGQNALKSIQKGATIITINSKDLSTVVIPLANIEKQIKKAQRYNEKLSTLYALKQEVKKLEDSLKNFYLEEGEED